MIKEALGLLVKPVAKVFSKREERKLATETLKGKLAQAKVEGQHQVTITDAEWESISASGLGESWKDEYITISFGSIINMIVIGALLAAFGFPQGELILEGVAKVGTVLTAMGVDLGFLLQAVVLASLGLKVWRG